MNKADCKWVAKWDYLAYEDVVNTPYIQQDWNQTLNTRINQCSTQIHQANLRSGADTIILNKNVLEIIKTLAYYNPDVKKISHRYDVIIDNSIIENVIYVTNLKLYNFKYKVGGTPMKIDEDLGDDEYRNLIIKKETFETEPEITEHKKRLLACIEIQNYKNPE